MNGLVTIGTIVISLFLGYSKGITSKCKKLTHEFEIVKEQNISLKKEIKKLKSIKYDYQIKTGTFIKKKSDEFKNDIQLTILLDYSMRNKYYSLYGALKELNLDMSHDNFDVEKLYLQFEQVILEKNYITYFFNNVEIVLNVLKVEDDIKTIFKERVNMDEYNISYKEVSEIIEEILKEKNNIDNNWSKKFAVHSHGTKK